MSNRIRNCLLVLSFFLLFTSLSCSSPQTGETTTLIEVTDQLGRTVKLDNIPKTIVSLAPANTEILFALGLDERIAGVTDYCNYPPKAKEKPSIGGFATPNIEKIVALSPDLILAAPIHEKQIIPQLEAKGMTVLTLAPKNLDDILEAITLVGKATSTEKAAAELVSQMRSKIKAITDKTGGLTEAQRPKVFYVIWHDPLTTVGSGTFHDELIRMAGGTNIAGNLNGYPTISLETIIEANPKVIIGGVGTGMSADAPLQFIKNESRLKDVDARLNNRIYSVDGDIVGRAGPRITNALEQFARFIHPELFKESK
ncbi:MAG: ABC transporter substrate-binding protein [Chloroflexota bacterium]